NNVAYGEFRVRCAGLLEQKEETLAHLPRFETPLYPVQVQGKIFSDQGETTDETWKFYTDDNTSANQYKIAVPLWDGKYTYVDFDPNILSGHFYFPYFNNARVMLAMELDRARIVRFVDWRVNNQTPVDGQGNQIILGIKDKDNTSILHNYVDSKPV